MKRILLLLTVICAALQMQADTIVSLIDIYPGRIFYELEGHSVLRIRTDAGDDTAISWGHFDFNTDDFIYRFVKGETDYMVAAIPWPYMQAQYASEGRRMVEHRIKLTGPQKERLLDIIHDNLRPENRTYRYNYVKDNCATRPLRAIELAVGDSIMLAPSAMEAQPLVPVTFRNIMRHYHRNYPWYQFGIDLALGSGIDYPLNRRETAFAPVELDSQVRDATAGGRKLFAAPSVILDVPGDAAVLPPTPWYLTPMAVSCLILLLAAAVTWHDRRRRKVTRWLDALLFGVFGLAGCLLTFLIFVSVHEATSPNWLYLWLNPAALIVPVFIWLKSCKKVVLSYQIVNFALLLIMCVAWYWIPQSANPAFWPLILADALRAINYISLNVSSKDA